MVSLEKKIEVGVRAEWDQAKVILMHEPGIEAQILAMHYPSALFEKPINISEAIMQHRGFVKNLERNGAEVYLVRYVLENLADEKDLRRLAYKMLWYKGKGMLTKKEISAKRNRDEYVDPKWDYERVKQQVINNSGKKELVDIILLNPTIRWGGKVNKGTYKESKKYFNPLGNLLFTRDHMITTNKGIVLSRMRTRQRAKEVEVMDLVLRSLGIKPIYRVQPDKGGFLEGGDYFSMGDFCLLGIGSRTNYKGAKELMENDVFGFDTVVLVRNKECGQQQMHLDTYFNTLDKGAVVMLGESINPNCEDRLRTVEVWYKQENIYKKDKAHLGQGFEEFMREKG